MLRETRFTKMLSKTFGTNLQRFKDERSYRIHKCYNYILIVIYLAVSLWSSLGKCWSIKSYLSITLELISSTIAAIIIIASAFFEVSSKNKTLQYLRQKAEKYLYTFLIDEQYAGKEPDSFIRLLVVHIVFLILFVPDTYISIQLMTFGKYKYFLINNINAYAITLRIIHIINCISFLEFGFKTVNKMLINLLNPLQKGKTNEVIQIKQLTKTHDILCEIISNLNKAIGSSILLIMVYTFFLILQCVEMMINHWKNELWENIPKTLKLTMTCCVLAICIMLVSNCQTATKEANNTSVTSFKILLENLPFDEVKKDAKINLVCQELHTLAAQVSQTKPSFTAVGFFTIDYSMLYDMIATVIAYIVIIIQLTSSIKLLF